jgi:hypothetical protein
VSLQLLRYVIEELPASLQQRVIDYGSYINEAARDIYADVGVEQPSRRAVDRLVMVAGLRKFWSMLEFQRNTLNAILDQRWFDMNGVVARGTYITRNSEEVQAVNAMRDDLQAVLEQADVMHMVRMSSLTDIARELRYS